jgi:hypothetical protein
MYPERQKYLAAAILICFSILCMIPPLTLSVDAANWSKSIKKLLPSNQDISPWRKSGPAKIYKKTRLFEYINGGAEIYFEYGFNRAITQEYDQAEQTLVVDVYEMKDAKAAFGIYSYSRDYKKPSLKIGGDGTQSEFQIVFWQDRFFVVVMGTGPAELAETILHRFAHNISARIKKTAEPPELIALLPAKGLIPRSRGYVSGILGLNNILYLGQKDILEIGSTRVEGVLAAYRHNNEMAHLLIVQYKNPQKAEEKKSLVRAIFSEKYHTCDQKNSVYQDDKGLFYAVEAVDKCLSIIFKSGSALIVNEISKQLTSCAIK